MSTTSCLSLLTGKLFPPSINKTKIESRDNLYKKCQLISYIDNFGIIERKHGDSTFQSL